MKNFGVGRKHSAIVLRRKGLSIVSIEKKLGINRSTLSGWFKDVVLTPQQKERLANNKLRSLARGRILAKKWHNEGKRMRLKEAQDDAKKIIKIINLGKREIIELALAMLYLGDGFKGNYTGMGNSDQLVLKTFVSFLKNECGVPIENIRCGLYLRADQNSDSLKKFWSGELGVPITNFTKTNIDKRTSGSKTYENYKGVCAVNCGNVAIQRRLVNIGRMFCEKISKRL